MTEFFNWFVFEAPGWARLVILGGTGLTIGAILGEIVRRALNLSQAPSWLIGLPMLIALVLAKPIVDSMQPLPIAEVTISKLQNADMPDYVRALFAKDEEARKVYESSLVAIQRLELPEEEKLRMASTSALRALAMSAEKYRTRAQPESIREMMSFVIDIAKKLEERPALCAGYIQSFSGTGAGYNLNELNSYLGSDANREWDELNRKLIFEGLQVAEAPVNFSPSTELELQELAASTGFPPDKFSPDFTTFSEAGICRWFIDYTEFLISQSNTDLKRFYQNDFAFGHYMQTLANGDTAWDVSLLGTGTSGHRFYQLTASQIGTDDALSFNCEVGGGNESEQLIYFVGPDPTKSGKVDVSIESVGAFQEMGDVENDTNILVIASDKDPVFQRLVDAIRGEKSVLIGRGSAAPQSFKFEGGSAFVDTYIASCSGNKG
ncbi:MAG: hypothetical protein V7651_18395 [Hyphomonas oceanitis]|uniref:hypothetical protein n=1 Tax=Hyphomonas oceanitis TaxID=81033 RepID=UPI003002846F